tara:strand:+ start:2555 stop:5260 length:2706 start_codon:yes stop_codon:yes gene_type:complete
MTSEYHQFLKNHKHIKGENDITHTRIPNPTLNIYGGSFSIPEEELNKFNQLYYNYVFEKRQKEYLTEKQMSTGGPLLIDIDLRFEPSIKIRQYNENHIIDLIQLYLEELKKLVVFTDKEFNIVVFEKEEMNLQDTVSKDGIHLLFGIQLDHTIQKLLRENIVKEVGEIWNDIPIINSWNSVFDEGISAGYTNWQLFGSRKPGHMPYKLSKYYSCQYLDDFELNQMSDYDMEVLFPQISARYTKNPKFEIQDHVVVEPLSKPKLKIKQIDNTEPENISSQEELDHAIESHLKKCRDENNDDTYLKDTGMFHLQEIHEYTMCLPESFYGPGTYSNWIRVAWALRRTHNSLLLTWLKFSSQSSEFKFSDIPSLCKIWNNINVSDAEKKLTVRSIIYWAREYGSKSELSKIEHSSVDYFVRETLKPGGATDHNFAMVLYTMFKGRYVCVSVKHNIWFEYKKHRWHNIDSGTNLRAKISKDMHKRYIPKLTEATSKLADLDNTEGEQNAKDYIAFLINKLMPRLKQTSDKDKIMKEARELFYDEDFIEKQDSNPYLLGFNNGVYDFDEENFRDGRPDDYIVKCTNYDYIPEYKLDKTLLNEVDLFMEQLFPVPELRKYMWEHLSSTLIGTNENQTFNIYSGSGRNGKSMLVLLMSKVLGDYKGTVPVTLITQKRPTIGGTSSEVVALKGTRYAVMQEPSKGDKINEGIMKELTGGDPLQGRALYSNSEVFIPQFKLVCCLNQLFDIESQDDGTWRRIRVCEFMSKFCENPVNNDPEQPYQFKVNKKLEERFDDWKAAMVCRLISISKILKGNVNDCEIVMAKSREYREDQDYLSEFIKEKVEVRTGGIIKKREIADEFRDWYKNNYGMSMKGIASVPKNKEIWDIMNKQYGKYKGGWKNVSIIYDE